ncbi:MAG: hypothetical protein U1E39_16840 [Planctomycetota bacterium]
MANPRRVRLIRSSRHKKRPDGRDFFGTWDDGLEGLLAPTIRRATRNATTPGGAVSAGSSTKKRSAGIVRSPAPEEQWSRRAPTTSTSVPRRVREGGLRGERAHAPGLSSKRWTGLTETIRSYDDTIERLVRRPTP